MKIVEQRRNWRMVGIGEIRFTHFFDYHNGSRRARKGDTSLAGEVVETSMAEHQQVYVRYGD